ncbi:MAG: hypothetical protein A2277_00435 [Desulfobacterales bacterium RIFOXYA12_FULL_46_15]|nr:MAG: hypothetical protein A2277_00435 [Desulfobacterales bacterium RIFOXYA12_FULL_46_15]
MSLILGINLSHNRSACLIRDGRILVAIEEERLDRRKYSPGFIFTGKLKNFARVSPMKAITYCLDAAGVGIDEVDLVLGNKAAEDHSLQLLREELPIKDKNKILQLPEPSHHLAHAYSTYFCSPFEESAIMVVDGWGSATNRGKDIESESFFLGRGNSIQRLYSRNRDKSQLSLGLFYDFFSSRLGFHLPFIDETSGSFGAGFTEPGKTMGLAAFGRHREDWDSVIQHDNGMISIGYKEVVSQFLYWKAMEKPPPVENSETPRYEQPFWKDIAYKAQDELENALVYLANHLFKITKCKNLCLAGGVSLNVSANSKILKQTPFENIYTQPAANDGGNAIGCAYYGYHECLGGQERLALNSVYIGRDYSDEKVRSCLIAEKGIIWRETSTLEVAGLLAEGKLVGWFQGGSEFGPRALGHRSILADPRNPKSKIILNERIKCRESFRPFAPAVLQELAGDFFELPCPSPFMLLVSDVKEDKKKVIPSVTHVDGSARIQTVAEDSDRDFRRLIEAFYRITGVPMVLNTSLNLKGEPIAETPSDALNCLLRSELDCLVLSRYLVEKTNSPNM